ncbi:MAG: nucleotidyl transferase AbiEii/AbiGii toxin family protein, partial [Acidobacteriota bacterium]
MEPRRPEHLDEIAQLCLQAVAQAGLGHLISVGGAVGLLHYLDHRPTHDVDAWWSSQTSADDRERLVGVLEKALSPLGEVRQQSWGDVLSIDLQREGKTVFNFQIARRSAQLRPTSAAPWVEVQLDSLDDLLASKMVALVERGAPRDFRDIYAACQADVSTAEKCWQLWRRRQELSGSDTDLHRARLAVQ